MARAIGITVIAIVLFGLPVAAQAQLFLGQARAVDGDTLAFGDQRVRLAGIDAPEKQQTCTQGGTEWACGKEAAETLERFIEGKQLRCTTSGHDVYGRAVAKCLVGRLDLAGLMIDAGFAFAGDDAPEAYRTAFHYVRNRKLGMWAGEVDLPADWRAAHPDQAIQRPAAAPAPSNREQQASRRVSSRSNAATGQCLIKGNRSRRGERIYHLPGRPYYAQTRAEEWFCTEAEAQAAGYRRSKA